MRNPFTTAIEAVLAVAAAALLIFLAYDNVRMALRLVTLEQQREAMVAEVALQRATFEARARQREREQHAALAGVRQILEKELHDAQETHAAVVAGLHADNLSLRRHWQGCVATAELSAAAATAAGVDDGAELRAHGAADLVRAGAQCDARIRALQSALTIYAGDAQ